MSQSQSEIERAVARGVQRAKTQQQALNRALDRARIIAYHHERAAAARRAWIADRDGVIG